MVPVLAFQVSVGEDERTTLPLSGRSGISEASLSTVRAGVFEALPLRS